MTILHEKYGNLWRKYEKSGIYGENMEFMAEIGKLRKLLIYSENTELMVGIGKLRNVLRK